jgi:hypothetical protein
VNPGLVVVVEGGRATLRLNADSAQARRELGALAWAVLETLALDGGFDDADRWVACTNARDLGRRLNVGKDRAAAALATLRRAGLVVAHLGRAAGSARFAPSRYEVRVPVSCTTDAAPASDRTAAVARPSTRARGAHAHSDSPTLFTNS